MIDFRSLRAVIDWLLYCDCVRKKCGALNVFYGDYQDRGVAQCLVKYAIGNFIYVYVDYDVILRS